MISNHAVSLSDEELQSGRISRNSAVPSTRPCTSIRTTTSYATSDNSRHNHPSPPSLLQNSSSEEDISSSGSEFDTSRPRDVRGSYKRRRLSVKTPTTSKKLATLISPYYQDILRNLPVVHGPSVGPTGEYALSTINHVIDKGNRRTVCLIMTVT